MGSCGTNGHMKPEKEFRRVISLKLSRIHGQSTSYILIVWDCSTHTHIKRSALHLHQLKGIRQLVTLLNKIIKHKDKMLKHTSRVPKVVPCIILIYTGQEDKTRHKKNTANSTQHKANKTGNSIKQCISVTKLIRNLEYVSRNYLCMYCLRKAM